jgi:hypothetical protein
LQVLKKLELELELQMNVMLVALRPPHRCRLQKQEEHRSRRMRLPSCQRPRS